MNLSGPSSTRRNRRSCVASVYDCYWTLTTSPVLEPITVQEAKAQARISHDTEDRLIASYIQAAREQAEAYLGRGLYTQSWTLHLQTWAEVIYLPMAAPLQTVTSVKYYDTDGTQQTLSSSYYTVDTASLPGRITRASGQAWPSLQADRLSGTIQIVYVVGWTSIANIPEKFKQGIRLWVSAMDADRDGLDGTAQNARRAAEACWSDRVEWLWPVA